MVYVRLPWNTIRPRNGKKFGHTLQRGLEDAVLSEVSRSQRTDAVSFPRVLRLPGSRAHRDRAQTVVAQGSRDEGLAGVRGSRLARRRAPGAATGGGGTTMNIRNRNERRPRAGERANGLFYHNEKEATAEITVGPGPLQAWGSVPNRRGLCPRSRPCLSVLVALPRSHLRVGATIYLRVRVSHELVTSSGAGFYSLSLCPCISSHVFATKRYSVCSCNLVPALNCRTN